MKFKLIFVLSLFMGTLLAAEETADTTATDPAATDTGEGAKEGEAGTTEGGEEVPEEKCNLDLLHSFGIVGLESPRLMGMEMFPNITASCCRKSDQLEIFGHWVRAGEGKKIKKHYMEMADTYGNLLEEMLDVTAHARFMKEKLKTRKVSNCKLMANRIAGFKVKEVITNVKHSMRKMEEFFLQTYKGFYSTLCNADSLVFFDVAEKKIIYSERFCRDVVEHTLPSVIFWSVDVVKFFNLVSKFLVSCDYEGEFENDRKVPPEFIFSELKEEEKMLRSCKKNRNEVSWFSQCKFLCKKFNIAKLEPFFEPHKDKIKKYVEFVKESLEDIMESEGKIATFNSSILSSDVQEGEVAATEGEKKPEEGGAEKKAEANPASRILEEAQANATPEQTTTENPVPTDEAAKEEAQQLADNADPLKPTEPNPTEQLTTTEEQEKKDALNGASIFKGGLEKKIDLSTFEPVFELEGITPYTAGKSTLINHEIYMEVKVIIAFERHEESMRIHMEKKLKKLTEGTDTAERELLSASLVKGTILTVLLLLFTL